MFITTFIQASHIHMFFEPSVQTIKNFAMPLHRNLYLSSNMFLILEGDNYMANLYLFLALHPLTP